MIPIFFLVVQVRKPHTFRWRRHEFNIFIQLWKCREEVFIYEKSGNSVENARALQWKKWHEWKKMIMEVQLTGGFEFIRIFWLLIFVFLPKMSCEHMPCFELSFIRKHILIFFCSKIFHGINEATNHNIPICLVQIYSVHLVVRLPIEINCVR